MENCSRERDRERHRYRRSRSRSISFDRDRIYNSRKSPESSRNKDREDDRQRNKYRRSRSPTYKDRGRNERDYRKHETPTRPRPNYSESEDSYDG